MPVAKATADLILLKKCSIKLSQSSPLQKASSPYYLPFYACYLTSCGCYLPFCSCYPTSCGCYLTFCSCYPTSCGCYLTFCACYPTSCGCYLKYYKFFTRLYSPSFSANSILYQPLRLYSINVQKLRNCNTFYFPLYVTKRVEVVQNRNILQFIRRAAG